MDEKQTAPETSLHTRRLPLIVGLALLALVAAGAYFIPVPNNMLKGTMLLTLALAAACIAAIIPGFIEVKYSKWLSAGGALAIFCIVYFFKPQHSAADTQDFDLTVFVHGPNGKQHILLQNAGHLILDLDDDRRTPLIGDKGRTVFSGIPGRIREAGMRSTIGLDAPGYELVEPDKVYLLDETPLYIAIRKTEPIDTLASLPTKPEPPVSKKNKNCVVFGLVKDKNTDRVVHKARISLVCDAVYRSESETDGTFSLTLPAQYRGDRCLIRAEYGAKSKEMYVPLCDPNPIELKIE